jgi:hypothetical protein
LTACGIVKKKYYILELSSSIVFAMKGKENMSLLYYLQYDQQQQNGEVGTGKINKNIGHSNCQVKGIFCFKL